MFELIPFERRANRVATYDPFRDLEEFERSVFGGSSVMGSFRTDVIDTGDSYELEAELPGFKKEDIHVDVADDRLTVTAERHSNFEDKDKKNKYVRCERSYGTYARSFDISGIDAKAIKAAYSDGVLRVTLPKQKEVPASSRRLEIE